MNGLLVGCHAVGTGEVHTCAIVSDGTARCWGNNGVGQLGVPIAPPDVRPTPVEVGGIANAARLGVGGFHTCVSLLDNTMRCWGVNYSGQLGDGSQGQGGPTPVEVALP